MKAQLFFYLVNLKYKSKMDYISTTSLANELDMKPSDLFDKLKTNGWIERKNEKWILTELGVKKGGQTRTNPKFGEFIVWPENISINEAKNPTKDKPKLLNATAIGKNFEISSQRFNLLLNELGWIEKTVAGWRLTSLGKTLGGKQFEHETSGGTYVLWPETVLKNKDILELFDEKPCHPQPFPGLLRHSVILLIQRRHPNNPSGS